MNTTSGKVTETQQQCIYRRDMSMSVSSSHAHSQERNRKKMRHLEILSQFLLLMSWITNILVPARMDKIREHCAALFIKPKGYYSFFCTRRCWLLESFWDFNRSLFFFLLCALFDQENQDTTRKKQNSWLNGAGKHEEDSGDSVITSKGTKEDPHPDQTTRRQWPVTHRRERGKLSHGRHVCLLETVICRLLHVFIPLMAITFN